MKSKEKLNLLEKDLKESPWLVNVKSSSGLTPLIHLANRPTPYINAEVSTGDIARVLIESGADINVRDSFGYTPIKYAIESGNTDVVEALLEKIEKDKQLNPNFLLDALHSACKTKNSRIESLKTILRRCAPALVNHRNLIGKTALHIAIEDGDVAAVQCLLDAGADPSLRTFGFNTPSDLARRLDDEASRQILKLLQAAKARKASAPA